MNTRKTGNAPANQRRELEDSEKRAAAQQPGSFKEDETADKVVEVGPEMTDAPIKGIDPEQQKKRQPSKP
jgi:hypothetical protein